MLLSHPTRVRGLKPQYRGNFDGVEFAPHTGAWIETPTLLPILSASDVAPHTGAWIETLYRAWKTKKKMSHPTRVRGLKL